MTRDKPELLMDLNFAKIKIAEKDAEIEKLVEALRIIEAIPCPCAQIAQEALAQYEKEGGE